MPAIHNLDEFLVPDENREAESGAKGFLGDGSYAEQPIINSDDSTLAFSTPEGDPITRGLDAAMQIFSRAPTTDEFFAALDECWGKLVINASGHKVHWLAWDWMKGVRLATTVARERYRHKISDNQVEQFIASRLAALEAEIDADIAKNSSNTTKD